MSEWQRAYVQHQKVFVEREERLTAALADRVPVETHPCEMDGCDTAGTEMLIVFRELHWFGRTHHAVVP